MRLLKFYV